MSFFSRFRKTKAAEDCPSARSASKLAQASEHLEELRGDEVSFVDSSPAPRGGDLEATLAAARDARVVNTGSEGRTLGNVTSYRSSKKS